MIYMYLSQTKNVAMIFYRGSIFLYAVWWYTSWWLFRPQIDLGTAYRPAFNFLQADLVTAQLPVSHWFGWTFETNVLAILGSDSVQLGCQVFSYVSQSVFDKLDTIWARFIYLYGGLWVLMLQLLTCSNEHPIAVFWQQPKPFRPTINASLFQ